MKTCPYCAEEIQDAAVYCRFCSKKVKGIWARRTFIIMLILAAALTAYGYRKELKEANKKIRVFLEEMAELLREAKENIKHMGEYRKQMDELLGNVKK